jgi:hypothetical protein
MVNRHVTVVEPVCEQEGELFELVYNIFNPCEILSGQRDVNGFDELEQKLSNIITRVRLKKLPRVH